MSERQYRLLPGIVLITFLFFNWNAMVCACAGGLLFEGATNWRIPFPASRIRYGNGPCICAVHWSGNTGGTSGASPSWIPD
jgi:hypothetical protein